MYKQLFHIVFEFLFKCFFILFFVFILSSIIVSATDARPKMGHKHHRHAPKIHRKSKFISKAVMGITTAGIAFKALKSNHQHFSE